MANQVDPSLIVEDSHFEYLRLQKGKLHDLIDDRQRWLIAYQHDLANTYHEIREHLPAMCWGLLDIGSGLGGIDVLLSRHYGDQPYVNLLDGEDDPPEMKLHRQTFNSMKIARDFLVKNGVRSDRFGYLTTKADFVVKPYDVVVSFGSWCFHYEPDVYLPLLLSGGGLHSDSIIIVDVRNDRPDYDRQLRNALYQVAIVRRSTKFTRTVFRLRR